DGSPGAGFDGDAVDARPEDTSHTRRSHRGLGGDDSGAGHRLGDRLRDFRYDRRALRAVLARGRDWGTALRRRAVEPPGCSSGSVAPRLDREPVRRDGAAWRAPRVARTAPDRPGSGRGRRFALGTTI